MRRNVFQRTKKKIVDWYCGIDMDEYGNIINDTLERIQSVGDDEEGCVSGSSFSLYSMLGSGPDWADAVMTGTNKFKIGDKVTAVLKTDDAIGSFFHLASFLHLADVNHGYHIAVNKYEDKQSDDHFSAVVLISDEIKPQYEEWMLTYGKRVRDFERALPVIQEGDEVTGTAVTFKGRLRRDSCPDDLLFNEWMWIVENCDGQVFASSKCWIFEDSTDAIKYKLARF
jgi:hypothetical protein